MCFSQIQFVGTQKGYHTPRARFHFLHYKVGLAKLWYHNCQENSREIGNIILFSLLLVCYTKRNGHPGGVVPTIETDTPEGCPYDRNGHPGGVSLRWKRTPRRGVPMMETDTPEGCPYDGNGHPGRGIPRAETDTPEGCPYDRNGHPGRGSLR